jgi:hypothetical protein
MNSKIAQIVTEDVCRLTGLSREEHFMMQVDCGLEYLHLRYKDDALIRDSLSQSKDFWVWWRELWARRDQELMVNKNARLYCQIQVERFYQHWHSPETIVLYPNWSIIKNSISQLKQVHI